MELFTAIIGSVLIASLILGPYLSIELKLQVYAQSNVTIAKGNTTIMSSNKTDNNTSSITGNITGNLTANPTGNLSSAEVIISPGSSDQASKKSFDPNTITLQKGTTVKWTNKDSTLHTVTSGSPNGENSGAVFDSGQLFAGNTFQHVFNVTGTYDYYCIYHPWMTGKVIVS